MVLGRLRCIYDNLKANLKAKNEGSIKRFARFEVGCDIIKTTSKRTSKLKIQEVLSGLHDLRSFEVRPSLVFIILKG